MPEEPELDMDKLHEEIHEEVEREGGSLLKAIALTTALFAAMAGSSLTVVGNSLRIKRQRLS